MRFVPMPPARPRTIRPVMRSLLRAQLALACFLWSTFASATPQPLPLSYVYESLPKGGLEVEQYADYTPLRVVNAATGQSQIYGATQFQTEFEYGITDRLELGLYVEFQPLTSGVVQVPPLTEGNGIKERLRLRLADAGEWPVDVALYGELVENERELEIEAKIILQRRIGNLRLVCNLWGEVEDEFQNAGTGHPFDWVINPTLGATYQVTPSAHVGVESWLHEEFTALSTSGGGGTVGGSFNLGPHVYVGPALMLDFGNFWWSTGAYLRVTDFGRSLQPDVDAFGAVWFRMIVGLSF